MSRRRRRVHRRWLAAAAGAATVSLAVSEVARVWRRGPAPRPAGARDFVRGGEIAARETVGALREGYHSRSADESALLNLFLAFGLTFGVARAVTYSIRRGAGPFRDIRIGRRHIHHFIPGIALALGAGGTSIGYRNHAIDPWLAMPFGAGAALIIDETALLIELEDVYWSEKGALSIDIAFGTASLLALLALLARLLRRGEALVLRAPSAVDVHGQARC